MAKNIEIKITGSGTKTEIIQSLKDLINTIKSESEEGMTMGKTFEDNILCTKTN